MFSRNYMLFIFVSIEENEYIVNVYAVINSKQL